jgi:hypothetical protein
MCYVQAGPLFYRPFFSDRCVLQVRRIDQLSDRRQSAKDIMTGIGKIQLRASSSPAHALISSLRHTENHVKAR